MGRWWSEWQRRGSAKQAVLFSAVGFSNFVVDIAVYYSTYHFLHFNYIAAQAVSYPCGAINSYLLNRRLTFDRRGSFNPWEVFRFVVMNIVSVALSVLALFLAKHDFMLGVSWSKIIANGTALCTNFAGSKWFVFRRAKRVRD